MPRLWSWLIKGSSTKKKKNEEKDISKNTILGLRTQLETLQKRERHLVSRIEEQGVIARENVKINKKVAKAALRRKKAHEHSLDQTLAQIKAIELFASPERYLS